MDSVQNFHQKKFVPKSDSSSKRCLFCPFGSAFTVSTKHYKSQFVHARTRFVQIFSHFLALFCLERRIGKHAKFSKVNAAEKFGVDFFQPSAALFGQNKHNPLYFNCLVNFQKTRVFAKKIFFVQNLRILEGVNRSSVFNFVLKLIKN